MRCHFMFQACNFWRFIFKNVVGCKRDNTSHTCLFFDYFWGNIFRIILKKSFELLFFHTILLRFMIKIWQKMSSSKILKSIYKFFYYLKTNVTMLNECLCLFFPHWINFKFIHLFPWYIKNITI
jgi:hypothetical protein